MRALRRRPGFTAVAVLALALGIGANTTAFTALDAVALRPRPVRDPDSLARVFRATPSDPYGPMSYPDYVDYRDRSRVFSDLSMLAFGMAIVSSDLSVEGAPVAPRIAGTIGFHLPQLLEGSARPSDPPSSPATTSGCWARFPRGAGSYCPRTTRSGPRRWR